MATKIATRRILLVDLLAIIAGIAGGLGAVLFRYIIKITQELFFTDIYVVLDNSLPDLSLNPALILLPAIGGLIVGPLVARVAPETRGHGVPEVMEAVLLRGGRIRARVAAVKVLVSSITIGSGGSAGREGPIAQIGASVGSLIGQIARLSPHDLRLLVACGLSAGIAGTFNAPLGGAIFGLEILLRNVGPFDAIPVLFSSVIGAATASIFLGSRPSFEIPSVPQWSPIEIPVYILHGVIMGLIAVAWVKIFYTIEEFFSRLRIKLSLKPAIGGLFTGILLAMFPGYGIGGVGYEGVEMALMGVLTSSLMLILGISKILATSLTVGSGGSGGIFAPSLYIGSMFGGLLGRLYSDLFPSVAGDPLGYTLAGMASLFAGAAQAPLNVIIMIPEMSRSYSLIPPIMASAGASFIVSWLLLRGSSIYTIKLEKRGVKVRMLTSYILESVVAEEVMTRRFTTIPPEAPLAALETIFDETLQGDYIIVDRRKGELIGIVTRKDIENIKKQRPKDYTRIKAIEIAKRDIEVAYPDETIKEVLDKMKRSNQTTIPVVKREDRNKLVGIITMRDILRAYELALEKEEKGIETS
ncbi:MAG: chloride channel protein [Desulfurococcales archaeon]|nr:chloride channel protein [Desulfurococcales archaeon]